MEIMFKVREKETGREKRERGRDKEIETGKQRKKEKGIVTLTV